MARIVPSWVAALCGVALMLFSSGSAFAERKVALVVGNANYKNASLTLFNPKNDAEDVANALRALDFEVILTTDAGKRDMDVAMTRFARLATGADAALFFYAGHALQYQGRNYLMPTDGELEDEISLRYQMVLLDDVRAAVERADGVKIIVLDACRNNPVVDSLRQKMAGVSRGVEPTRGLARIDKALGMVVAYSTAADEVAADGTGRNSPFTSAFLKRLQEPGLEIGAMFRRVAADVNEKTNGRQRPETYVSLIGEYYLNQQDKPVWDRIKDTSDPAAFQNFIARFPSSPRASDAQYRMRMLQNFAREQVADQKKSEADTAAARARQAAADKERADKDRADKERAEAAAQKAANDEKIRLALLETQRQERARQEAEAAKAAVIKNQKQAAIVVAPPAVVQPPAPVQVQPSAVPLDQACKRDEERLARLRISQSRDEVILFERELGCERLRFQLARLKESILIDVSPALPAAAQVRVPTAPLPAPVAPPASAAAAPAAVPVRPPVAPPAVVANVQSPAPAASALTPAQQDEACKRDEQRLARLRASQSRDDILLFERELSCPRLRPQVVRLKESIGG